MVFLNKFKTFINDNDGLTIAEFTILLTLPLYLFVGVKYAMAQDLSTTQVDFFSILSYPILAAIAKQAIERFGFPNLRKGNNSNYTSGYQNYNNYNDNSYDILNNNEINTENINNTDSKSTI